MTPLSKERLEEIRAEHHKDMLRYCLLPKFLDTIPTEHFHRGELLSALDAERERREAADELCMASQKARHEAEERADRAEAGKADAVKLARDIFDDADILMNWPVYESRLKEIEKT